MCGLSSGYENEYGDDANGGDTSCSLKMCDENVNVPVSTVFKIVPEHGEVVRRSIVVECVMLMRQMIIQPVFKIVPEHGAAVQWSIVVECVMLMRQYDNTTCIQDCAGTWGGSATIDSCGVCVYGTTGLTACYTYLQADGIYQMEASGHYHYQIRRDLSTNQFYVYQKAQGVVRIQSKVVILPIWMDNWSAIFTASRSSDGTFGVPIGLDDVYFKFLSDFTKTTSSCTAHPPNFTTSITWNVPFPVTADNQNNDCR